MATDLTSLKTKTENNGMTTQGRLSAAEWNTAIDVLQSALNDIEALQQKHRYVDSEAAWDAIEQAKTYVEGGFYYIKEE